MPADFTSVRNWYEQPVLDAVTALACEHPTLDKELLPDVACVALNRLPTRYIRYRADLTFYLTAKERSESDRLVQDAVTYAFEFVRERQLTRNRD